MPARTIDRLRALPFEMTQHNNNHGNTIDFHKNGIILPSGSGRMDTVVEEWCVLISGTEGRL